MRQHKLWWQSSYDRVDLIGHKIYTIIYDYIQMLFVSKRKKCFSILYRKKKKDGDKAFILFKKMFCRMAKNSNRILERKKNAIQEKKQTYKWKNESKLERWKEDRQEWIYFNPFSKSPILRRGWIRKRTPTCIGKANGPLFITNGGSSSC